MHGAATLLVWDGERPVAEFQPGQWASVDDIAATTTGAPIPD
jgi:hypothetical protein